MGDSFKAISEDIKEYESQCRRFGEKVVYVDGGPDVYGKHATYMKVLSYRAEVLAGDLDEEIYNAYWITKGFDSRELDARLQGTAQRADSKVICTKTDSKPSPAASEPSRFRLLEID